MTKADYKKIILELNEQLAEKVEKIKKEQDKLKAAKSTVKKMITVDPRKQVIEEAVEKFKEEIKEMDGKK